MIHPLRDGSGWIGRDLTDESEWVVELDNDSIAALADHARRRAAGAVEHAFVPSTAMQVVLAEMSDALLHGRGFTLLRGLPVDRLDDAERRVLCTTIGELLGVPIRQNADGDELVRVRDEGKDFAQQGVRSYETAAPLPYHSDSSDVVGLLCVRAARSGGASTIVSSVALHDAMVDTDPGLAALLHESWPTASIVAGTVDWMPICAANGSGQVFTRYGRMYVETAHEYDASTDPLRPEQIAALDLYDSLLADPTFVLDMHFRPGDLQLLNNYRIMHGRAPYTDHAEPALRRELLRIWLVMPELELPAVFENSGFVPRSEALA
jgi:hypothetical protein